MVTFLIHLVLYVYMYIVVENLYNFEKLYVFFLIYLCGFIIVTNDR